MTMPGFNADASLYRTGFDYKRRGGSSGGASGDTVRAQQAGEHCWWDDQVCHNHTLYVRCVRWVNGMPQYFSRGVGSC